MNTGHFAGRIGQAAEIRHTPGGNVVAGFSLAVDVRKGGEKQTLWIDCSIWGDRAEKLAPYLTKGASVAVAGDVGVRTYEKRDGTHAASITCNVRDLTLLGGGRDQEASEDRPRAQAPQRQAQQQPPDLGTDDIPF
jgi:single-strand DNA-binding protein